MHNEWISIMPQSANNPFVTPFNSKEARETGVALGVSQLRNPTAKAIKSFGSNLQGLAANLSSLNRRPERDLTAEAEAARFAVQVHQEIANSASPMSGMDAFNHKNMRLAEWIPKRGKELGLNQSSRRTRDRNALARVWKAYDKSFGPAFFATVNLKHIEAQRTVWDQTVGNGVSLVQNTGEIGDVYDSLTNEAGRIFQGSPSKQTDARAQIGQKLVGGAVRRIFENSDAAIEQSLVSSMARVNSGVDEETIEFSEQTVLGDVEEERENAHKSLIEFTRQVAAKGGAVNLAVLRTNVESYYNRKKDKVKQFYKQRDATKKITDENITNFLRDNMYAESSHTTPQITTFTQLKEYDKGRSDEIIAANKNYDKLIESGNFSRSGTNSLKRDSKLTKEAVILLGMRSGRNDEFELLEGVNVGISKEEIAKLSEMDVSERIPLVKQILNDKKHPQYNLRVEELTDMFFHKDGKFYYNDLAQALHFEGKGRILNRARISSSSLPEDKKRTLLAEEGRLASLKVGERTSSIAANLDTGVLTITEALAEIDKLPIDFTQKENLKQTMRSKDSEVNRMTDQVIKRLEPLISDFIGPTIGGTGKVIPNPRGQRFKIFFRKAIKDRISWIKRSVQRRALDPKRESKDFITEALRLADKIEREELSNYFIKDSQGVTHSVPSFVQNIKEGAKFLKPLGNPIDYRRYKDKDVSELNREMRRVSRNVIRVKNTLGSKSKTFQNLMQERSNLKKIIRFKQASERFGVPAPDYLYKSGQSGKPPGLKPSDIDRRIQSIESEEAQLDQEMHQSVEAYLRKYPDAVDPTTGLLKRQTTVEMERLGTKPSRIAPLEGGP